MSDIPDNLLSVSRREAPRFRLICWSSRPTDEHSPWQTQKSDVVLTCFLAGSIRTTCPQCSDPEQHRFPSAITKDTMPHSTTPSDTVPSVRYGTRTMLIDAKKVSFSSPATAGPSDFRQINWIMDMKDVRHLELTGELWKVTDCGEIYGLSSLPYDHHRTSTVTVCSGYSMSHGQYLLYRDAEDAVITKNLSTKPQSYVESFEKFSEGFQRNLTYTERAESEAITIITSRALLQEYIEAKGELPANCVVLDFYGIGDVVSHVQRLRGIHRRRVLDDFFSSMPVSETGDTEQGESEEDSEEET